MFKKKKCERCGKKFDGKYSYCPYCGKRYFNDNENEDWGLLGRDDFVPSIKFPTEFSELFNSIFKSLSKELHEQLNENYFQTDEKPKKIKKEGISISISTFGNGPPKIKVRQLGENPIPEVKDKIKEKIKKNTFTKEKIKKFANLKKEEPKTNIRRLSNKVIYELEMPGVKSLDDVSIIKLENSIEIKAISKNKAYSKIIPINLPITNYNLSEGKLILELGIKN
jgi:HSP20 family molecular chaperone IbpA